MLEPTELLTGTFVINVNFDKAQGFVALLVSVNNSIDGSWYAIYSLFKISLNKEHKHLILLSTFNSGCNKKVQL